MKNDVNLLILSCGTRNKIVQYFKKELNGRGKVIATDCDRLAPALYEADEAVIVPRMSSEGYIDEIFAVCKEFNVNAVLSLIDPELSLLAKHKQDFLDIGVMPIIPDWDVVEMCFDKYKMVKFLSQNGFNTIKTYVDKELFYKGIEAGDIEYPVFVKPIQGSASMNINKVTSRDGIELLFSKFDDLMIQEFMDGTEYGADVYIDMISGEVVSIFVKEKIKMRAGETDKSVSMKDKRLFDLMTEFAEVSGMRGVIDLDIFKVKGKYYISEVNPRFGGGHPHAYECGVNIPEMIVNNMEGNVNYPVIGDYDAGMYMMKFNEVMVTNLSVVTVKKGGTDHARYPYYCSLYTGAKRKRKRSVPLPSGEVK
ncbi:ATP-grasp domain-containing protein [Sporosarcina aquimarina]|uniref:ATP-grasp domain-containing protein n=1 Tax=Sporosarcina aquimarina TaxID=114975 RepID=A0ABU4G2T7_9BACL|nr:ATP-grasp domain-containing protein [Sporosarcina aquimarina]MDW0110672.1 ATP-grasp domain-containing protein [Sporosarcina aquimarina]